MRKNREQRAKELLEFVREGPVFFDPAKLGVEFHETLRGGVPYQYRQWSASHLIPKLCDLIPEFRSAFLNQTKTTPPS